MVWGADPNFQVPFLKSKVLKFLFIFYSPIFFNLHGSKYFLQSYFFFNLHGSKLKK